MAVYSIGSIDEYPAGSHRVVRIGKIEVGVYNLDGAIYALPNFCPHQQGPLCEGPTTGEWRCSARTGWRHEYGRRGEIVVCPWHGTEFDLTTGRCLSSPKFRVRTYVVTVSDGMVTISTDRT